MRGYSAWMRGTVPGCGGTVPGCGVQCLDVGYSAWMRGYSAWMRGTVPGRADHSCHQAWAGTGQGATPLAGRTLTKSPGQTCVPPFAEKRLPVTCNNWSKSRVFPGCGIFSATTGCGKPGQLITFLSESYPGFRFSSKG